MKEKLKLKYIPSFFCQQLLDKWNSKLNETSRPPIAKFDEYLNRCSAIELEPPKQTLSRFRSGPREDNQREL